MPELSCPAHTIPAKSPPLLHNGILTIQGMNYSTPLIRSHKPSTFISAPGSGSSIIEKKPLSNSSGRMVVVRNFYDYIDDRFFLAYK